MDKIFNDGLPFEASGRIPLNLDAYDLIVDVSGSGDQQFEQDAESVVTCLIDAGQAGMIPAEGVHPDESTIELLSREKIAEDKLRYISRVRNVHPAAYRMLLNMFAQLHQTSQPWQRVYIDHLPAAEDSLVVGDPLIRQVSFPKRWSKLPFDLVLDEFGTQVDMHTVRIEFAKNLEPAHFDIVGAALENWTFMVMFGAYRDTYEVMEDFPIAPSEIYMADPRTVEQTIRAFQAPDIVFEALINFATKVHLTLDSVARLEIV